MYMKTGEIIRTVMKDKGVTQVALAAMMGFSSQGTVGNMLKRENIDTDVLIGILDKLGYEVVVQPKTQGQRKAGSIVIEASGKESVRSKGGNK